MSEQISVIDCAQLLPFKFECYSIHPLQAPDRLGNPDIDFPIGMAFGDRDKFGSEGAELIIKSNRHFESGRSQLFKVKDCAHPMMFDQPFELIRLMVGFFEGTITGKFEPKPRNEVTLQEKNETSNAKCEKRVIVRMASLDRHVSMLEVNKMEVSTTESESDVQNDQTYRNAKLEDK